MMERQTQSRKDRSLQEVGLFMAIRHIGESRPVLGFSRPILSDQITSLLFAIFLWLFVWDIPFLEMDGQPPPISPWPIVLTNIVLVIVFVIDRKAFFFASLAIFATAHQQVTLVPVFQISGLSVFTTDIMLVILGLTIVFTSKRELLWKAKQLRWIRLFFAWGLLEILAGLPAHGLRAIGEARNGPLLILFLFYALIVYHKRPFTEELFRPLFWSSMVVLWKLLLISFHNPFKTLESSQNWLAGEGAFYEFTVARLLNATESLVLAMCFVAISVALFFRKRWKLSPGLLFYYLCLLVGLILGQTRTVWVATSITILTIPFFVGLRRFNWSSMAILVFFLLFSVGVLVLIFGDNVVASILSSAQFIKGWQGDQNFAWRVSSWIAVLEQFLASPIWGMGYGARFSYEISSFTYTLVPHNGYIELLYKQGSVGLLLFVLAVAPFLRPSCIEQESSQNVKFSIVITLVLLNLVFMVGYYQTPFLWTLLAIIVNAQLVQKEQLQFPRKGAL
jgi:O-antigen ligase